jgi:exportin-2 (importin alpha re-exporter)
MPNLFPKIQDTDTRRRAASDLVQGLCSQFEKQVVAIFSSYVSALLQVK